MEANNLFEANEERLKQARKEYSNSWKREWRKKRKESGVAFKPFFTNQELILLRKTAKEYGLSTTALIRQSVLSVTQNRPLLPNVEQLRKIEQLLALVYNKLNTNYSSLSHEDKELLLARLSVLEKWFGELYRNPPSLMEAIQESLKTQPGFLEEITKLIYHHSTNDY